MIVLVALGVALGSLALWLVRRTRPEPQLLAPLEEMETRAWRKQDPAAQRRALDASRPAGARPVRREAAEPVVDTEFAASRPVVGFDDLVDVPAPTAPVGDDDTVDQPRPDPGDGAGDDPVDDSLVETGEDPVADVAVVAVGDDLDIDEPDLDDTDEPDLDDTDEPDLDDTDDSDDGDDETGPVMPGEGLLRRSRPT